MATEAISTNVTAFGSMSPQRVLIFAGIALIAAGMLFGDIFAVFVLHQNGGQTGAALLAASRAVAVGNSRVVEDTFQRIGGLLEDHGTKVDAHVHMTGAGYLALLLALLQPYVALPKKRKRLLAWWFVAGGVLLPTGIFLIHYVGLAYSPSPVIGWESRVLLSGGTLLVLLGFLYGAWYAGIDLYEHEARETKILKSILDSATSGQGDATLAVADFGSLAAERAVKIAAHSHIIEFGLLAILLAFIQPYVYLSEIWKRRWVIVLLAGSVVLPVFVLLELRLGLLAGGIADAGGLMVIVALIAMLVGVLRHSGSIDGATGAQV